VLLREALAPDWLDFPAEELAGLACEEGVESRLIRQTGESAWHLEHGPLEEAVFGELPESHWTLLVQDVDKHVPEVARILEAFGFLPDWRIDDIMISYATDEGGVGPHTDNYDVFLIQAQGQRRWRLSESDYSDDDLLDDCPLRVLRTFDTSEDWVLNPGDVLYLPPRLAHWGTAVGDCMTWSVGMRGPSQHELLDAWLQYRASQAGTRYFHDQLTPGREPVNGILSDEFAQARSLMQGLLPDDDREFRRWFGTFVTEPKPDFEIEPIETPLQAAQLKALVAGGQPLVRHPWARFACINTDPAPALCAQGECFEAPPELASAVTKIGDQRHLSPELLLALEPQDALWSWLGQLFNRGLLIADD
jgi:50S ribosomal protein L16 3-hydroxylase